MGIVEVSPNRGIHPPLGIPNFGVVTAKNGQPFALKAAPTRIERTITVVAGGSPDAWRGASQPRLFSVCGLLGRPGLYLSIVNAVTLFHA